MKSTRRSWAVHLGFNLSQAKQELGDELPTNYNSLLKRCIQSETARLIADAMAGEKSYRIDYDRSLAKFCDKAKYRAGVLEAVTATAKAFSPNDSSGEA
jgi:hypothetical protein